MEVPQWVRFRDPGVSGCGTLRITIRLMGLCEHLGQDNGIEEPCEDPPHSVNCEFAELDFRLLPPLPPTNNPTTAVVTTSCKLVTGPRKKQ